MCSPELRPQLVGEKVSNQSLIGHVEPNLLKQKGQKIVQSSALSLSN